MHVIRADDVSLQGLVERQVARMWLSPKGAMSPLHYDSHMSILTQVRPIQRRLQQFMACSPFVCFPGQLDDGAVLATC